MLVLHQPGRVVQWPTSEVAMLREEWGGRLEATHADGQVAHRPGPLTAGEPLWRVAPGVLVNPRHARLHEGRLVLPGGWELPAAALPEPGPPEPLPPILARVRGRWVTPDGGSPSPQDIARTEPELVPVGRHLVHPAAVRALERHRHQVWVTLVGGRLLKGSWTTSDELSRRLGLPWPDALEGLPHRVAYERGLRDWPRELVELDLTGYRSDPPRLVEQALWQVYRYRQQGRGERFGRTPRGLHYAPMMPLAMRAGLLKEEGEAAAGLHLPAGLARLWRASLPRREALARRPRAWTADRLWLTLLDRLDFLVGEARLVTHCELGMRDQGAGSRSVGRHRPATVLLVEKSSLEFDARLVAEMFGVSMLVLGGAPTFISTEFFLAELKPRGPLDIVSFCDFDPYGWHFPEVFAAQASRYGSLCRGLVRLVKPERFSPAELERLAIPLSRSPSKRAIVDRFVEESGGVNGRALGLYADYLRPVERLVAAFRDETGLEPVEGDRCRS